MWVPALTAVAGGRADAEPVGFRGPRHHLAIPASSMADWSALLTGPALTALATGSAKDVAFFVSATTAESALLTGERSENTSTD